MSAFRGAEPKTLPEALELYVRARDMGPALFQLIDPFEAAELGKHLVASLSLVGDQLMKAEDHIRALTMTLQEMERILAAKVAEEAGGQTLIDFAQLAADADAYEADRTAETEAKRAAWIEAIEHATRQAERFLPIPWSQGNVVSSTIDTGVHWQGRQADFDRDPQGVIKVVAAEIASFMQGQTAPTAPAPEPRSGVIETTSTDV